MYSIVVFALMITCFQRIGCHIGGHFIKDPDFEKSRLNFFDTDLFRFTAEDSPFNVIISPASIKSTLAMILEGAKGNTAEEIKNALRLSPRKEEFREELNKYLLALQANSSGAFLQNSNAVFISNKLRLRKEYELMMRKVYLSEVSTLDFHNPILAANFINNWINSKTAGLIPFIIEPAHIKPTSGIVLTNALYFKSKWQFAFDAKQTRSECFLSRGFCKTVPMMELFHELNYAYVDDLRAHAVELPYEGGRYSMIVIVPRDRAGVGALIRDLPYVSLTQISKLMEPTDVQLLMPKFTVDFSEDMVGVLRNLRITTLFSPAANLTGILDNDSAQINGILHKVHLSVDETGTVAAAATSAMVIPLIHSSVQITVDHPFVFFITDNDLGIVLFEGKIEEPKGYEETNGLNGQNIANSFRYPK